MKYVILAVFLTLVPGGERAHGGSEFVDPLVLYPKGLAFDVMRNEEKVGTHKVRFVRENDGSLRVYSEMKLSVTMLFVPVYGYSYSSEAVWRDGGLAWLRAVQDDNGEVSSVSVRATGEGLKIIGPENPVVSKVPLFPTNHWHSGVLYVDRVIDTLSGKIARVAILDTGQDTISAQGRTVAVRKFVYTGDINTTVWYDQHGRWTGMAFNAKGGSRIVYKCVECGLLRVGTNG